MNHLLKIWHVRKDRKVTAAFPTLSKALHSLAAVENDTIKNWHISRKRKYLAIATPDLLSRASNWLKVAEMALASFIIVFATGIGLVAASRPGELLHPYKTAARESWVRFRPSSVENKATATVNLTREHTLAAQSVVLKNNVEPSQKHAAISELTKQTKMALERVAGAVTGEKPNVAPEEKQRLVRELENLTSQQLELAQNIVADHPVNENTDANTEADKILAQAKANAETAARLSIALNIPPPPPADATNKTDNDRNTNTSAESETPNKETGTEIDGTKKSVEKSPAQTDKNAIIILDEETPIAPPQIFGGFILELPE